MVLHTETNLSFFLPRIIMYRVTKAHVFVEQSFDQMAFVRGNISRYYTFPSLSFLLFFLLR